MHVNRFDFDSIYMVLVLIENNTDNNMNQAINKNNREKSLYQSEKKKSHIEMVKTRAQK